MFELTINNQVYQFNFGMGFLRDVNKIISVPVDGAPGVKKEAGMRYMIARVIDGEPDALVYILDLANKGQDPRLTKKTIESYIEDEETDIDKLFDDVINFLSRANVTRKVTKNILEAVEKQKEQ